MLAVGCNGPLDDRQFCVKQQMASEEAFPTLPQTDEQRQRFITDCLAAMPAKHQSGEYERSVDCFNKNISGKGHANEEFLAFKRCESGH